MPSLFSGRGAEGWHAPAGRRTCEPRPLVQDGQIRPAVPVGAIKTWDPADRSFRRTTRAASAESEVRPGPRLPTLRPHHLKTGEAGPEALPTLSLPGRTHYPHSPCREGHPPGTAPPRRNLRQAVATPVRRLPGRRRCASDACPAPEAERVSPLPRIHAAHRALKALSGRPHRGIGPPGKLSDIRQPGPPPPVPHHTPQSLRRARAD